jgi:hypothetical protein
MLLTKFIYFPCLFSACHLTNSSITKNVHSQTEIARRIAKLSQAPFIKVEATKFTEVGFHGKDVDQIIKDLVEISITMTTKKLKEVRSTVHFLMIFSASARCIYRFSVPILKLKFVAFMIYLFSASEREGSGGRGREDSDQTSW